MAAVRAAIDAFLDAHWQEEIAFLAEMVKVPSDNPPGDCRAHGGRAAALLEKLGFAVERHVVPEATVKAHGMISATNLIVRHRFGPGPTVALNAHGDVVPPGGGWTVDPYGAVVKDGWMYGRGVAVSKSDFATFTYALLALKASGAALGGTVELHFTYDEEVGGEIGPKWLLDQGLSKPDYAISAGFSYGIVTAHNGCLHLEVTVTGKSAHAAFPATGHDALEAATAIMDALYKARKTFASIRSAVPGIDHPSLTIGLIQGGINTNVVPDNVAFRLDRRMIPEEDPGKVERELIALIQQAAVGREGIACAVRRILLAEPFKPVPGQERLVAAIAHHAKDVLGEAVKPHGVPLYTDARHYSAAGIPTVLYGAGPRSPLEANAHRADERLPLDDLRRATGIVALALADLLEAR
ncbi:MAG: ArgE/DapE family deacylase [Alphaproteobacteria bacterium]|nr:ArgE/DapE family deacylase [Alphaproteobacteria bacterium]